MTGSTYQPESKMSLYQGYFGQDAEDVIIQFNEDSSLFEWVLPASCDRDELPDSIASGKFTSPSEAFTTMENFLENAKRKKRKAAEAEKVFDKDKTETKKVAANGSKARK